MRSTRALAAWALVCAVAALSGCGGGATRAVGSTPLRLLNASPACASLDLKVDDALKSSPGCRAIRRSAPASAA